MKPKLEDYTIMTSPIAEDDGGGYLATILEMQGCLGDGETVEAAIDKLRDSFVSLLAVLKQDKKAIPKPKQMTSHSGQFLMRVPKSLHRQLALQAECESVSMNQLAMAYIAQGLGRDLKPKPAKQRGLDVKNVKNVKRVK